MLEEIKSEFEKMDQEIAQAELPGTDDQVNSAPGAGVDQVVSEPVNSPDVIAGSLTMAINMIKPLYPSLEKVYTPEVIQQIAESGCALANKHNWNILGFFAKYMEEITFAGVMIPTAINTYKAIDSDMKAKAKAEQEQHDMQEAA